MEKETSNCIPKKRIIREAPCVKRLNFDFIDEDFFNLYIENISNFINGIDYFMFLNKENDVNYDYIASKKDRFEDIIIKLYKDRSTEDYCQETVTSLIQIYNERFFKLIEFSHKNNIYFNYCSFSVYNKTFDIRYSEFNNHFIETEKLDFLKSEYKHILKIHQRLKNSAYLDDRMMNIIKNSKLKKIEFLEESLKNSNIEIKIFKNDLPSINHFHIEFIENKTDKLIINTPSIDIKKAFTSGNYLGQPTNDAANELFDYLIQYYRPEDNSSIKFINILHYLKNDANKDLYIFKVKQSEFKKIIQAKMGIEIKKFAKSERYIEAEKPILSALERSFQKNKG
jgi:hypothetical protein